MPGRSAGSAAWASVVSPSPTPPRRVPNSTCVPFSTRATKRSCGKALSPRLAPGYPKLAPFPAVSATSRQEGHIQAGPVQADQPPRPIPRPLGGSHRNRAHHLLVELAQRRLAQAGAGLRDTAPARHLDRPSAPEPAQALQEAAQDLAGAGAPVERQGNRVVDHNLSRQVALTLARPPGLGQHPTDLISRKRPGNHAEADVVAETDASPKAGRSTGHRSQSLKTRPTA